MRERASLLLRPLITLLTGGADDLKGGRQGRGLRE
jgi:hypothetical protein